MRIPCPFCGSRDSREFVYRGDAAPTRPMGEDATTDSNAMYDYVYLRDNPAGLIEELWYHAQGCRNWLRVARHTRTHEVTGAALAKAAPANTGDAA
ncbi:MAG TPA: sarcosine oxidase subunit delta [Novosphingobium sp.]|nr:sarcosine oxidase subunit delta [Novosphingobium sp.]